MDEGEFCAFCNRYLEPGAAVCPHCGHARIDFAELEDLLEEPFRRIEEQTSRLPQARMERMERLLESLERDLDEFLSREPRPSRS